MKKIEADILISKIDDAVKEKFSDNDFLDHIEMSSINLYENKKGILSAHAVFKFKRK